MTITAKEATRELYRARDVKSKDDKLICTNFIMNQFEDCVLSAIARCENWFYIDNSLRTEKINLLMLSYEITKLGYDVEALTGVDPHCIQQLVVRFPAWEDLA